MKLGGKGKAGGAALVALTLVLTPALAATTEQKAKKARPAPSLLRSGSFTPAVTDPRLAAELVRRGFSANSFRFTPAVSPSKSRAVRVAVRARASNPADTGRRVGDATASPVTAITPTAYNLGVAVGWKRFALSGDVARVTGSGPLVAGREAAEVGVSYSGSRFTGRVEAGVDRPETAQARAISPEVGYSVGVGGSYRLTRNLDVTGGVRYRIQNDRLEPLADERRDSQAVYIGTAFRF